MAILDRGILGGGRNAVGTVVMTKWRGKDVIRARVTPANPQTAAQTEQRDLFALLTRAGSTLIDAFVRPYWRRYERSGRNATTAFNEFVRANVRVMRGAGVAGQPPGTFDSAQLLLTRGPLEPADPTGLADDAGQVQVTWEPAAGPAGDAVAIVATTLDGALALIETGAVRGDGSLTVPVGFGERGMYAFHVVAYRPGANGAPGSTVVGFHGSVRFDGDANAGAGGDLIVTAMQKRAAYAAATVAGAPAEVPPAALV